MSATSLAHFAGMHTLSYDWLPPASGPCTVSISLIPQSQGGKGRGGVAVGLSGLGLPAGPLTLGQGQGGAGSLGPLPAWNSLPLFCLLLFGLL